MKTKAKYSIAIIAAALFILNLPWSIITSVTSLFPGSVTGCELYAQSPPWIWAKSAAGSDYDEAHGIGLDANGNIYISGIFWSPTVSFDAIIIENAGGAFSPSDIFLAKYDPYGNAVWARAYGGDKSEVCFHMSVDAAGYSYITGYFKSSSITFGSTVLTNPDPGTEAFYMAKVDADGNVVWAKSAAGDDYVWGLGVAADGGGNSYAVGMFYGDSVVFDAYTLHNAGGRDIFLVKYDVNGNVVWVRSAGGAEDDLAVGIYADAEGYTYTTGAFMSSTITFGPYTLTNDPGLREDIFVVKVDPEGSAVWATSAGGTWDDTGLNLAVDDNGNCFVTGLFQSDQITFGTTTLVNAGLANDVFVVKYNAQGNVQWAVSAGGDYYDTGNDIAVDASGNAYVTGYFESSSITFGSNTFMNTGAWDVFLVSYDAGGNLIYATQVGAADGEEAYAVTVDANRRAYVSGYFQSTSLSFGSYTLINQGYPDIFVAKIEAAPLGVNEVSGSNSFSVYPNPSEGWIMVQSMNGAGQFLITDMAGKVMYEGKLHTLNTTKIDCSDLPKGMYIARFIQDGKESTAKVVIE